MVTRTVKFLGQGYENTEVTINATFDGEVVYTGAVPTINEGFPNPAPEATAVLFTAEIA